MDLTNMFTCPIDGCPWQHEAQPIVIPEDATPEDTESLIAAGQARTDEVTAALTVHFHEHSPVEWANQVARLRRALAERPPLLCFGCYVDRHLAQRRGEPLPPQRLVQLITPNGAGHCLDHVKLQDGPVVPGRTPGGIILGGGGQPMPPMNGG